MIFCLFSNTNFTLPSPLPLTCSTMNFPLLFQLSPQTFAVQMLIVGIWCTMLLVWLYLMFAYAYQTLLAYLTIAFFLGCQYCYGGLENLLVEQAKRPSLEPYFGAEEAPKQK